MIWEQTAQEGQNREHRSICSDSTVQINPGDTTMMWRVGGYRICCTRSEWQVQLFVSECYRFLTPPDKAKASHNALIPSRGCCKENGSLISKSGCWPFPAIMSVVVSTISFAFCFAPFSCVPKDCFAPFSPTARHIPPYRHWLCPLLWLKGPSLHSPYPLLKNPNWWTRYDPADSVCEFSHKGCVTKLN